MGTLVCEYAPAVDVVRAGISVCALAEFAPPASPSRPRQWMLMEESRLFRALLAIAYVSQNFAYGENSYRFALVKCTHAAFKPLEEDHSFLDIAGRVMAPLDTEKQLFNRNVGANPTVKLYDMAGNIALAQVRQALYDRHGQPIQEFCREVEFQFGVMQNPEMARLVLEQWGEIARLR
jgi:hypothetical protein